MALSWGEHPVHIALVATGEGTEAQRRASACWRSHHWLELLWGLSGYSLLLSPLPAPFEPGSLLLILGISQQLSLSFLWLLWQLLPSSLSPVWEEESPYLELAESSELILPSLSAHGECVYCSCHIVSWSVGTLKMDIIFIKATGEKGKGKTGFGYLKE